VSRVDRYLVEVRMDQDGHNRVTAPSPSARKRSLVWDSEVVLRKRRDRREAGA
jgi:hypothetical protein